MNKAMAYLCLLFGVACYGLLALWIARLWRVGGLSQIPQMLTSLGWETGAYGAGLLVLGLIFLMAAAEGEGLGMRELRLGLGLLWV